MKLDRLTEKGQEAMVASDALTVQYKNAQLEPEHLLLALLDQSGGIAAQIVTKLGASPDRLRTRVEGGVGRLPKTYGVRGKTGITDFMVVACGAVDRHVKAVANNVINETRKAGLRPLGVEGEREGEWVLVDLGDVIVHVMTPQIRDFYQLEKLWMD